MIAFIVGIAIVLVFFLMDKLLYFVPASLAGIIQYMSTEFHLSNISRGVIDTRNLIYFGSKINQITSINYTSGYIAEVKLGTHVLDNTC